MPLKVSDLFLKKGTGKLTTGAKVGIATALATGTYLLVKSKQKKRNQSKEEVLPPDVKQKIEDQKPETQQNRPLEKKKSNLPLIIGVSLGGVILVVGLIYFTTKKGK